MSQYLGDISAYALAVSQGYTGTEEEYAELMASYATVGQTAVTAAQTATTKASEAATSATTATNKASEATTAATTATTKAGEASTSASTATSAKDTAVSASQTATSKASEATTAAATAVSAKDDAVSANTAAQSAKTAAQTAQTGAETAAASVEASAEQIATNAEDISQLKSGLTQKANQDGYYADLVSGGATQILSDMVETDTTPYNYRTAGGSLEIGDREKLKKIVGGSLAVNQLINIPDGTTTAYGVTFSASNGVVTYSGTVADNAPSYLEIFSTNDTSRIVAGHKYVMLVNDTNKPTLTARYGYCLVNNPYTECPYPASTLTSRMYAPTAQSTYIICRLSTGDKQGQTISGKVSFNFIDLTLALGSTIADYVYTLETATAGAGVAWLKSHFPRIFDAGYIPYNAGTLEHVNGLSAHNMTGFNQWDEEWEVGLINSTGVPISGSNTIRSKNFCRILPNTKYYMTCGRTDGGNQNIYYLGIFFYDKNKQFVSRVFSNRVPFVTPNNAAYFKITTNSSTVVYGNTYNHDICINLHWDGERDGEYEPYEEHSYPLDSDVTLRGIPKLDSNNNLYYDGDEYEADGTVTRRYGIVDLGTLNWSKYVVSNIPVFYTSADIPGLKPNSGANSVCSKYPCSYWSSLSARIDKSVEIHPTVGRPYIADSDYTDTATFKAAMSGVYLVYKLTTPTTESADPYTEIQNVSNWGTEEFVTTSLVPVGHETEYQPDLRAKIEVAPESPDTDGMYLMKRENGQNSYVAYLGELPSDPTTDGTYTLKCTVASGTATKTWEADT